MPDPKKYDLDFRPLDYFASDHPKPRELTLVDGEDPLVRVLLDYLQERDGSAGTDSRADSTSGPLVTDEQQTAEPPSFFGGCCLPYLGDTEVEIARIRLESATFDIISVRARLEDGRIFYSVVDEYEGQFEYTCRPDSSDRPLTMGELIGLIENTETRLEYTGLVLGMIQYKFEYSGYAEEWVHFASVSSSFYPELHDWYEDAMEEWFEANRGSNPFQERQELPHVD